MLMKQIFGSGRVGISRIWRLRITNNRFNEWSHRRKKNMSFRLNASPLSSLTSVHVLKAQHDNKCLKSLLQR
jgi:hypothetical protein